MSGRELPRLGEARLEKAPARAPRPRWDPLLACPVCATPTPTDRIIEEPWCCSIACYRRFHRLDEPQARPPRGGPAAAAEPPGMPTMIAASEIDELGRLLVGVARWLHDDGGAEGAALLGYCAVAGAVPAAAGWESLLDLLDTWVGRCGRSWVR